MHIKIPYVVMKTTISLSKRGGLVSQTLVTFSRNFIWCQQGRLSSHNWCHGGETILEMNNMHSLRVHIYSHTT